MLTLSIRSGLLHHDPQICQTREMLHAADFELQVSASARCQAIRLAAPRRVLFFDSLDPFILEQPSQRAVERARAQHDAPIAHLLDVLQYRIPMPRLFRQTKKDEQHGLGEW